MRMRNLSVAIVVAALVGTFPVIEALAQPPSNDSRAGAVLVTSVPFLLRGGHERSNGERPEVLLEQRVGLLQAACRQ